MVLTDNNLQTPKISTKKFVLSALSSLIILMSILVIFGWISDISFVKRPIPGVAAMNPTTALLFAFIGIALLLRSRTTRYSNTYNTALFIHFLVGICALFHLISFYSESLPSLDKFLLSTKVQTDLDKGLDSRMAFNTAIGFLLLSSSSLLLEHKSAWLKITGHVLNLSIFPISLFSIIGYIFNAPEYVGILSRLPMSITTAFALLLSAYIILIQFRHIGITKEYFAAYSGAWIGRLFLLGFTFFTISLGYVLLYISNKQLLSMELGNTLYVLFLLLFSAIFITSTITLINKKDKLQKLNEQKFKALLTAAPDGILVVNQEGTIEVVNNKVLELFGYTKTELLGKTVEELVPVEFKSRHVSFRNSYFQDETKSRAMGMGLELYGLRKDRTKFAVEISLSPVNLEGNTMVFSSIRDVTLRNLERAKSRQKDLIFQTLVDRIEDYAIIHLDGEGRVTSWNNGAKNILGYDQKDILGRNFSILFNESNGDSRQLTEFIQQARTNKRVEEERNIIKKDGNTFWSHFVITPINSVEDTPAGFVMVLRDETKNKLTEQLLTSFNEELKLEVELKTQELAGLTNQLRSFSSHLQEAREQERKYIARELHDELGQMLTGLRMDMVWLKTHISPEHTDLKKRIEQALQLLNETKESMRRISKQLHPSQLEDLGLNAAISSLCKDFQSRTNFNLSLKNELVEDLRLPIPANLTLAVYRIIQESLTNILKHSNADKIDLSLEEIGGVINVTISDNGTGFDIKNVSGNTSLGIIGMRERALSVSGTFDISSGNEGTRVKLSVPLAKKYQN